MLYHGCLIRLVEIEKLRALANGFQKRIANRARTFAITFAS